jgi:15-cis-phytoene synthase
MPTRSSDRAFADPDDLAACAALLRQGSRTFHAASLVLPRTLRDPATALYAFCRLADDAVDLGGDDANAVAVLHARLDRAYAGHPLQIPADRAFAGAVRHFRIPRAVPEALLEGFAWDAEGRRYETFSDLVAYAVRVAGTVGAMMAALMGAREPRTSSPAPAIWASRCSSRTSAATSARTLAQAVIYLPLTWMRDAGIDPDAWLARPKHSAALGDVVRRLLAEADVLYERAAGGIGALPAPCRPGMHAARILYAEIGREVERRDADSVSTRAVVTSARKLQCLAAAGVAAATMPRRTAGPCRPEARFLVEALAVTAQPDRQYEGRVAWMVDLFDRLERRDQMDGATSRTGSA